MKFATRVFYGAGVWGILILTPMYFLYLVWGVLFAIAFAKTTALREPSTHARIV